jgi:hypothetical protein
VQWVLPIRPWLIDYDQIGFARSGLYIHSASPPYSIFRIAPPEQMAICMGA